MLKKTKRANDQSSREEPPVKLNKTSKAETNLKKFGGTEKLIKDKNKSKTLEKNDKKSAIASKNSGGAVKVGKEKDKPKTFEKNSKNLLYKDKPYNKTFKKPFQNNSQKQNDGKPPDWNEFKKKKKEVQLKRKEGKNLYDIVVQIKKIGHNLNSKTLKGGEEERQGMIEEIHGILNGKHLYPKLVMAHDMARIVQYMLKYGSEKIRDEIAEELKSIVVDMLQSKYARYCVKYLFKNGKPKIHSELIKFFYGNAVKLASHVISAQIFNEAFSANATPLQKQHLIQEFFGDMYKQSKDDSVKHLKDVYETCPDMKTAALGATKSNLQRVLNKQLLDSNLIQIVLMQYLEECSKEDRSEMISQLAEHVTILSNSKEGVRAVMNCIWHGTNKDRKVIVKTLKEHVLPLSKHEHGYCSIITLIDSIDDTLLINKAILTEILKNASDLLSSEWGRKVLLWLVAPGNTSYFHPKFTNELKIGRENSGCKKDANIRYKEILNYVLNPLLEQISKEPQKWFSNSNNAIVTAAILKAGSGEELEKAFQSLSSLITDINWKIKEGEKETLGVENAGFHMILKKTIQNDKTSEDGNPKFGAILVKNLTDEVISSWIQFNRGCFLLLNIYQSNSEKVQKKLRKLLKPHRNSLIESSTAGSNLLIEKLSKQ